MVYREPLGFARRPDPLQLPIARYRNGGCRRQFWGAGFNDLSNHHRKHQFRIVDFRAAFQLLRHPASREKVQRTRAKREGLGMEEDGFHRLVSNLL